MPGQASRAPARGESDSSLVGTSAAMGAGTADELLAATARPPSSTADSTRLDLGDLRTRRKRALPPLPSPASPHPPLPSPPPPPPPPPSSSSLLSPPLISSPPPLSSPPSPPWASQLFALLRLADLRVRQGRFEEAERLLEGFDWHASAKRLLARIALARGDLALAGDLGRLCLESTPPTDPDCAPVLALLVEVQLARGDLAAAEETLDQLAVLAVTARTTGRAPSPSSPAARSEPLEETSKRAQTSKRRWSCSPGSASPSKPRRPGSRWRARSPRPRRQQRSKRRGTRLKGSSASAQPGTLTRRRPCSASSEPRRGRSRRGTGR